MQVELVCVNAVGEAAESAGNPIGGVTETRSRTHLAARGLHSCLFVDSLNFTSVKLECLSRFATKDEHISAVQLDTSDRLGAHKLHIVDFKLSPLLARYSCSIVATVFVPFVNTSRACIHLVHEQLVADLGL